MPTRKSVPEIRITSVNGAQPPAAGAHVVYWMTAARRTKSNFALQHAVELAERAGVPILIVEALRCDYRWASDRLHRFVVDGMIDNAVACEHAGITYLPYVEPELDAGRGLLAALAADACAVVTDEFPCFFLPRMIEGACRAISVPLYQVDGNGILPLRAIDKAQSTAYSFRRALQKELHRHVNVAPVRDPLRRAAKLGRADVPAAARRFLESAAAPRDLSLNTLPIDHSVAPTLTRGGSVVAGKLVSKFVSQRLERYDADRNQPQEPICSGLSPYLHFGHIAAHDVFTEVMKREEWCPADVPVAGKGQRAGWWGLSPDAEGFLDQLLTWRELGYNFCFHNPTSYDRYESLPAWAQATLEEHADDPRDHIYTLDQFEAAETHDELWNAAQNQLRREGTIHNYLRMLWGKKILEWTEHPRDALDVMIELNNKYALDGRNPNSFSGIFWTLGRFDRAWGTRPVFGKIRYMSSANTARKVRVRDYIREYGEVSLFS